MTTLQQALDTAVAGARKAKESIAVEGATGHAADLNNMVLAYRGDELVAQIFPQNRNDRDALLNCAAAAAKGFEADVLALVFETWKANDPINPLTGNRWGPGEMQDAAEHHNGVAQGWVVDCLMVAAYNRAGDNLSAMLPYRLDHQQVVWESDAIEATTMTEGYVPDVMREVMLAPSIQQTMLGQGGLTPADFGLNMEQGRAHIDCAMAKMLLGLMPAPKGFPRAIVALAARPDTDRWRVIQNSMPPATIIEVLARQ